jgi:hypothetical protein
MMLADMPSCLLLTEIASSIYLRKTSSYLLREAFKTNQSALLGKNSQPGKEEKKEKNFLG